MPASQTLIYPDAITKVWADTENPVTVSVGNDTLSYGTTTALGSTINAGQSNTFYSTIFIRTAADGAVVLKYYDDWDHPTTDPLTDDELEVLESAYINVMDPDFGAVGDGVTDDTAAIQAAIDALPTPASQSSGDRHLGGRIYFPRGIYKCSSALDLDDLVGVTFEGQSAGRGGYSYRPAAVIRYTGSGSSPFISAKSSSSVSLRDLAVTYTHASYTGNLIDFSQSAALTDASNMVFERCLIGGDHIGGSPVNGAACLVSLKKAIIGTFRDCNFQFAQIGISGDPASGGAYSNAHTFDNCEFNNLRVAALHEAGEDWTVINPTMEGTSGGSSMAMQRAYYQEDTGSVLHELNIVGGWFGDAVEVENWIETAASSTLNLKMYGGLYSQFPGSNAVVKLGGPSLVTCHGALMSGPDYAFDLPTPHSAQTCYGDISGNNLSGVSYPGISNLSEQMTVNVHSNHWTFGEELGKLVLNGHIVSYNFDGPAIAAGAAAGASPTVTLASGSDDTSGHITVTTGASGTTTGTLCTVTPALTRRSSGTLLRAQITAANGPAGANAPGFFTATSDGSSFDIRVGTTPATGTTFQFYYWVHQ